MWANIAAIVLGVFILIFRRRIAERRVRFWHRSKKDGDVWEQGYRIMVVLIALVFITGGIAGVIAYMMKG